jgi:mannose-1-phosphate guanylyltransferase
VDRLRPMFPPERMWVLTNEHVRDEIVRQLPEIPKKQIFAEPAQRNTASIWDWPLTYSPASIPTR